MKIRTILVVAALYAAPACGQAPQQIVQCRPLRPGDVLGPDDSIVGSGDNTQVCSVVLVKRAPAAAAPIVDQPATVAPAVATPQAVAQPPVAGTQEKKDAPKAFVQSSAPNNSCLIVTSAEGHRMRNAIIAGVFTGGIGLATGLIASGGRYEYRDAINVPPAQVKMKYKGEDLQKLQQQGVHVVVVRKNDKQGESEAIQNGRNACFPPVPSVSAQAVQ